MQVHSGSYDENCSSQFPGRARVAGKSCNSPRHACIELALRGSSHVQTKRTEAIKQVLDSCSSRKKTVDITARHQNKGDFPSARDVSIRMSKESRAALVVPALNRRCCQLNLTRR